MMPLTFTMAASIGELGKITTECLHGNLPGVDGVHLSFIAVQMRKDLFLRTGGVDDDGAVFFQTVRYVNGIKKRLVHDNDIIRIINIGMYPDDIGT